MGDIKICAIAAAADNNVIGKDNDIPWHIPADFKHFKKTTMGKPMIMGRKTFESLPGLLPGRPHMIVSRSGFTAEGTESFDNLDDAVEAAKSFASDNNLDEIFIIGGAQIYKQALPLCDRLYLSRIHITPDGDATFPEIDQNVWNAVAAERHEAEGDKPAWTAFTLDRAAA